MIDEFPFARKADYAALIRPTMRAMAILLLAMTASAQEAPVASRQDPSADLGSRTAAEAAALNAQKVLEARRRAYGAEEEPVGVSMLQLITTPEKYQGKLVRVVAFLRIEFEGNALYLHKEDYDHRISKNAIWLDIDHDGMLKAPTINNQYVIAEGRFDGNLKGHMGMFSGTLSDVVRLESW